MKLVIAAALTAMALSFAPLTAQAVTAPNPTIAAESSFVQHVKFCKKWKFHCYKVKRCYYLKGKRICVVRKICRRVCVRY